MCSTEFMAHDPESDITNEKTKRLTYTRTVNDRNSSHYKLQYPWCLALRGGPSPLTRAGDADDATRRPTSSTTRKCQRVGASRADGLNSGANVFLLAQVSKAVEPSTCVGHVCCVEIQPHIVGQTTWLRWLNMATALLVSLSSWQKWQSRYVPQLQNNYAV